MGQLQKTLCLILTDRPVCAIKEAEISYWRRSAPPGQAGQVRMPVGLRRSLLDVIRRAKLALNISNFRIRGLPLLARRGGPSDSRNVAQLLSSRGGVEDQSQSKNSLIEIDHFLRPRPTALALRARLRQ